MRIREKEGIFFPRNSQGRAGLAVSLPPQEDLIRSLVIVPSIQKGTFGIFHPYDIGIVRVLMDPPGADKIHPEPRTVYENIIFGGEYLSLRAAEKEGKRRIKELILSGTK